MHFSSSTLPIDSYQKLRGLRLTDVATGTLKCNTHVSRRHTLLAIHILASPKFLRRTLRCELERASRSESLRYFDDQSLPRADHTKGEQAISSAMIRIYLYCLQTRMVTLATRSSIESFKSRKISLCREHDTADDLDKHKPPGATAYLSKLLTRTPQKDPSPSHRRPRSISASPWPPFGFATSFRLLPFSLPPWRRPRRLAVRGVPRARSARQIARAPVTVVACLRHRGAMGRY